MTEPVVLSMKSARPCCQSCVAAGILVHDAHAALATCCLQSAMYVYLGGLGAGGLRCGPGLDLIGEVITTGIH